MDSRRGLASALVGSDAARPWHDPPAVERADGRRLARPGGRSPLARREEGPHVVRRGVREQRLPVRPGRRRTASGRARRTPRCARPVPPRGEGRAGVPPESRIVAGAGGRAAGDLCRATCTRWAARTRAGKYGLPVASATSLMVTLPSMTLTPRGERWIGSRRGHHSRVGHGGDVGERRVGEGQRGGDRHHSGHVVHAVVDDSVLHEGRSPVRGGSRSGHRAALVDTQVDDDRARLHRPHRVLRDQHGRPRPRHEDRADDHIGRGDLRLDGQLVAVQGLHRRKRPARRCPERPDRCRGPWSALPCRRRWLAAFEPAMPAPRITTLAGLTPVAPPSSLPLPPLMRSRK